jgi:hypothetical protein
VSADAASVASGSEVTPRSLARLRTAPLVALALGLAFGIRLVLVWSRATPNYFPDEYLYAALGRSLSAFDAPTIRGASTHFPALLQPVLTAPAWRVGGVETGYRIVQALSALAITLAGVPTFLLARKLGIGRAVAGALALFALVVPDTLYASFVIAEPFAYPLVLGAFVAGVVALARPTRGAQLAFVALAGLAAFSRIQFVVLPVAWLVAAAIVAARDTGLRRVVREQRLVLGVFGALGVVALASGLGKLLGYYSSVLHPNVDAVGIVKSLSLNALVLVYAGGWILIPGALLGLGVMLTRPRSRLELAFAALTVCVGTAFLAQAALFGEAALAQERYVFYVLPLLAIAFVSYANHGWPYRRTYALLAAALLVASLRFPLSDYSAVDTMKHSPVLLGFFWLQMHTSPANAAMTVAVAATALTGVAILAAQRPRAGRPLVLGLALGASALALAAVTSFDTTNSRNVLQNFLPAQREWVDEANVGRATLLVTPGQGKTDTEEQLFWNRSIDRLAVMPFTPAPDRMHTDKVDVAGDGTLIVGNAPLRGAVVVGTAFDTTVFRHAHITARAPYFKLVDPGGRAQLALQMVGRDSEGRLAPRGALFLWPKAAGEGLAGWLEVTLRAPASGSADVHLDHGRFERVLHVAPGTSSSVRVPVCSDRPWIAGFNLRSAEAPPTTSVPRFVADSRACAAKRARTGADSVRA